MVGTLTPSFELERPNTARGISSKPGRLDVWTSRSFHKHGHRNVALVPRVLRAVPPDVDPKRVEEAVAWLDEHWRGDVCVPDELLPLVTAA